MSTSREALVSAIAASPLAAAAGLPFGEVYQADTLDSVEARPFVVVRWTDKVSGVGPVSVRDVELWVYDEQGDYTRAEAVGHALMVDLTEIDPMKTDSGHLMEVRTNGASLGQGRDMYDEAYEASVIPYYISVIHTGI